MNVRMTPSLSADCCRKAKTQVTFASKIGEDLKAAARNYEGDEPKLQLFGRKGRTVARLDRLA